MSYSRAARRALRAGVPAIVALASLGALAGLGWGLGGQPEYVATASAVLVDRGDAAERLGAGVGGAAGPAGPERLLELAGSEEAAELAAAGLGDDVPGADLLARTSFRIGDGGAALIVRSRASFADFAAAAATAYRDAVVELADSLERRRLQGTARRLEQRLAELDPFSERAIDLQERLADVDALRAAGPPLEPGREASLPLEPVDERPVALLTALGALGGAALAVAALLLVARSRRAPELASAELTRALGAPVLAAVDRPAAVRLREPGVIELERRAPGRERLADVIGLAADRGPASLAVGSLDERDTHGALALDLAAIAARRGLETILLEAPPSDQLAGRLGVSGLPGLADYLIGDARPREVISPIAVRPDRPSAEPHAFAAVCAGSMLGDDELAGSADRLRRLIERLGRVYDLVVVDLPPLLGARAVPRIAAAAGAAVLCLRDGEERNSELRAAAELLGSELLGAVLLDGGTAARDVEPPAE